MFWEWLKGICRNILNWFKRIFYRRRIQENDANGATNFNEPLISQNQAEINNLEANNLNRATNLFNTSHRRASDTWNKVKNWFHNLCRNNENQNIEVTSENLLNQDEESADDSQTLEEEIIELGREDRVVLSQQENLRYKFHEDDEEIENLLSEFPEDMEYMKNMKEFYKSELKEVADEFGSYMDNENDEFKLKNIYSRYKLEKGRIKTNIICYTERYKGEIERREATEKFRNEEREARRKFEDEEREATRKFEDEEREARRKFEDEEREARRKFEDKRWETEKKWREKNSQLRQEGFQAFIDIVGIFFHAIALQNKGLKKLCKVTERIYNENVALKYMIYKNYMANRQNNFHISINQYQLNMNQIPQLDFLNVERYKQLELTYEPKPTMEQNENHLSEKI